MGTDSSNLSQRPKTEEMPVAPTSEAVNLPPGVENFSASVVDALPILASLDENSQPLDTENFSDENIGIGLESIPPLEGEPTVANAVAGNETMQTFVQALSQDIHSRMPEVTRAEIPQRINDVKAQLREVQALIDTDEDTVFATKDELLLQRLRLEHEVLRLRKLARDGVEDPNKANSLYMSGYQGEPGGGGIVNVDLGKVNNDRTVANMIVAGLSGISDEKIKSLDYSRKVLVLNELLELQKRIYSNEESKDRSGKFVDDAIARLNRTFIGEPATEAISKTEEYAEASAARRGKGKSSRRRRRQSSVDAEEDVANPQASTGETVEIAEESEADSQTLDPEYSKYTTYSVEQLVEAGFTVEGIKQNIDNLKKYLDDAINDESKKTDLKRELSFYRGTIEEIEARDEMTEQDEKYLIEIRFFAEVLSNIADEYNIDISNEDPDTDPAAAVEDPEADVVTDAETEEGRSELEDYIAKMTAELGIRELNTRATAWRREKFIEDLKTTGKITALTLAVIALIAGVAFSPIVAAGGAAVLGTSGIIWTGSKVRNWWAGGDPAEMARISRNIKHAEFLGKGIESLREKYWQDLTQEQQQAVISMQQGFTGAPGNRFSAIQGGIPENLGAFGRVNNTAGGATTSVL